MKIAEYKKIYELEESNWWFVGKRNLIFKFLKKYYLKGNLLDIGCGTGIILKNFEKFSKSYGIDASEEAIKFCKKRKLSEVKIGTADKLPFNNSSMGVVGIFDVLYHKNIKDDSKVLIEINRVLKKGGLLLLTDSADMNLWSRHDIMVEARERYSKCILSKKIKNAGFEIIKISYFNFFLYPLVFFVRKMDNILNKNKSPKSNVGKTNFIFNYLLKKVLYFEAFLLQYVNFPYGVSIFCVARKK